MEEIIINVKITGLNSEFDFMINIFYKIINQIPQFQIIRTKFKTIYKENNHQMPSHIQANYEVIMFTGSTSASTFNTGIETGIVTATTVHQIFCIAAGNITITPIKGPTFVWPGTAGQTMDIMVKSVTCTSGIFIGFRAKQVFAQSRGQGWLY